MEVFIAKVLVEDIDINTCSVEVFDTIEKAREWADSEIDIYGEDYNGAITERADNYYAMKAGDAYVTIEIEKHNIN